MALSEQDQEWIKLTSEKLTYAVVEKVLSKHIESCPHGRALFAAKWAIIGGCLASFIGGGTIGAALMKVFL